jgi:hypothetical protein
MAVSMKRALTEDGTESEIRMHWRFWEFAVVHHDYMPRHNCFQEVDAATQRQLAIAADKIVMNIHQQGSNTLVLRKDIAGRKFMLDHDCQLYQAMNQLDQRNIIFRHVPFMSTRFVISSCTSAAAGKVILSILTENGTQCIGTNTFHRTDRMTTVHIVINAMLVDENIMTRQTYIELKGNFTGNTYIATACALNPDAVWPYSLRNYCSTNHQKRIKAALNHRT